MKVWKKLRSKKNPGSASRITYKPLDPNLRDIRLLRIYPGGYDEVVRCSLSIVSLEHRPKFDALSYVWGDAGDTRTVYVDNVPFPATTNLESALRHIREHSCEATEELIPANRDVWIDAICINQSDVEERNQQVRMMKDIYSQASHVLIWLGLGDPHSDYLFDKVCNEEFVQDVESALEAGRLPNREQLRVATVVERNLMRRPWWTRVWVVQELVLARQDPTVLCGSRICSWSTMARLSFAVQTWLRDTSGELLPSYDVISALNPQLNVGATVSMFARLRRDYQVGGSLGANIPFDLSAQCNVTDTKDYVYGCLGFLSKEASSSLEVNYRRSAHEIYHEATAAAFRHNPVEFLGRSIIDLRFWPHCRQTPAWVPDLAHQRSPSSKPFTGWTAHTYHELGSRTFGRPSVQLGHGARILSLAGIRLDKVTQLCPLTKPDELAHLDDTAISSLDSGAIDSLDLPNDVTDILEPDSERLSIHIKGIQDAMAMFQAILSKKTAPDSPAHAVVEAHSMEDLFWLFVPRGQFFGQEITPDLKSLLWRVLSQRVTEQDIRRKWTSTADQRRWRDLRESVDLALETRAGQVAFATKTGHMGVSVPVIEIGDVVALIYGMTGPFILRPVHDGTYHMVGFAYVHGFMDPDILSEVGNEDFFEGLETVFDIS